MVVSIPASVYKKAIKKFGDRATDPIALPALIVFLDEAEKSPENLAKACTALDNDPEITKFIEDVRENLPPHFVKLFQKHTDQIRQQLELEFYRERDLKGDEGQPFTEIFDVLKTLVEDSLKTHAKLDDADQKAELRGQQLEKANTQIEETRKQSVELKTALETSREQSRIQAEELKNELVTANKTLDGEKAARILSEQQHEIDNATNKGKLKIAHIIEWSLGVITAVSGTMTGIEFINAHQHKPVDKGSQQTQQQQIQNAASSLKPSSDNAAQAPVSDAVVLKMSPYGLRGPKGETLCDLIDARQEVVLPAIKGSARVCLRPDRELVCRPQAAMQQSHP